MNTPVLVVTRANGKLYPAHPLTQAQLAEVRSLTHRYACIDGMSVRQTQRRLLERGYRRAVGTIAGDLARFPCEWCPRRLRRLAGRG